MSTTAVPDRFTTLPGGGRWESARNKHSQVGKLLEIHTELPGRIHVVLIRQPVGF